MTVSSCLIARDSRDAFIQAASSHINQHQAMHLKKIIPDRFSGPQIISPVKRLRPVELPCIALPSYPGRFPKPGSRSGSSPRILSNISIYKTVLFFRRPRTRRRPRHLRPSFLYFSRRSSGMEGTVFLALRMASMAAAVFCLEAALLGISGNSVLTSRDPVFFSDIGHAFLKYFQWTIMSACWIESTGRLKKTPADSTA